MRHRTAAERTILVAQIAKQCGEGEAKRLYDKFKLGETPQPRMRRWLRERIKDGPQPSQITLK